MVDNSNKPEYDEELLVVVDKQNALSSDYIPPGLVYLTDYGIRVASADMQLRFIVIEDLAIMFNMAELAGYKLFIISAYRSYQVQVDVYNYWVSVLGQEEADRSSARPGHSEHQLGTTMDVSVLGLEGDVFEEFGDTEAALWLSQNAYKYGFVMSYPQGSEAITGYQYEPWHYRYVGREIAQLIYASGDIPIEYLKKLKKEYNN